MKTRMTVLMDSIVVPGPMAPSPDALNIGYEQFTTSFSGKQPYTD